MSDLEVMLLDASMLLSLTSGLLQMSLLDHPSDVAGDLKSGKCMPRLWHGGLASPDCDQRVADPPSQSIKVHEARRKQGPHKPMLHL